jgi:hypothetical protein
MAESVCFIPVLTGTAGAALLLLPSILAFALAPTNAWGHLVALTVESLTLLFILRASLVRRRMMVAAVIAVSLALLSALVLAILGIGPGSSTRIIGAMIVLLAPLWIIGAMIVLLAPLTIIGRLLAHQEEITVSTIWRALCLYLLGGLFFALLYMGRRRPRRPQVLRR